MATTNLTHEQEEYLAYIVSSAEQLKTVVSDILDFKQLGTEFSIERHPIAVRECLSEALQQSDITTISGSSAPGVQAYIADDVPEFIMSDRGRLVQVLVTLIHNSLRFTAREERLVNISIQTIPSTPEQTQKSISPLSTSNTSTDTNTPTLTTTTTTTTTTSTTANTPIVSPPLQTATSTVPTVYNHPSIRIPSPTTVVTPVQSKILQITVSDNGVGIDPSKMPEVFQPDSSLSKMKYIVELLGGEIGVSSQGTNKGATVTVTLKAEVWVPPLHSPPRSVPRSPPSQNFIFPSSLSRPGSIAKQDAKFAELSVLLVEDNLMNQRVLRRLFSKIGITPDVASDGTEAVEYIAKKRYDIVFMDLHMPVCDGFEATRQIQDLPAHLHKPHIYALTASVSAADKEKCMSLGMKGHLLKPVSVQALVEALRSVCFF